MKQKIQSALISVFDKDGLENVISLLQKHGITIYSTGGTQQFIEGLGVSCVPVEYITGFPSILGGRVKTLHPSVFGGILGRRELETDITEMRDHKIPAIDLVIVDLYPFEETLRTTNEESKIIEKIDIGGPSMIRAAAKNFKHVLVVGDKKEYAALEEILSTGNAETNIDERKNFAALAFESVAHYDVVISAYFNDNNGTFFQETATPKQGLRYGENPHQQGAFYGELSQLFEKLNGKELSYNNLVDVDAAVQLIAEFSAAENEKVFAVIKHTNVCGIAQRKTVKEAWDAGLAGDPESAFGGVLVTNALVEAETAEAINGIFFEVLIAPGFSEDALQVLRSKKNRILLQLKQLPSSGGQFKGLLNGVIRQDNDKGNYETWKEEGGRDSTAEERSNLEFANLVCKHLKSNAIALVKDMQLIGKGCGQTSRIDALKQAIEKARQFNFDLHGAVMASDAFFPFDDCVRIAHVEGITAIIQPGGSIRDKDSIAFCKEHDLPMVITGMRHFRH